MDAYLNWLESSIAAKLAGGAIGKVVFVRAHCQWTADHGVLSPVLDAALAVVVGWVGSGVRRREVQGSPASGFLNALVDFEGGQTALVASEATLGGEPQTQLLIVGQHGTVRFDDYPDPGLLREPPKAVRR
jgi:hypothetical protein